MAHINSHFIPEKWSKLEHYKLCWPSFLKPIKETPKTHKVFPHKTHKCHRLDRAEPRLTKALKMKLSISLWL